MKIIHSFIILLLIFKSDYACGQWQWISPLPTGQNLSIVSFVNNTTGYIVSAASVFYKTTDAGNTWNTLSDLSKNYPPNKLEYMNPNVGFMNYHQTSENRLYKTSNGGLNWFSCFSFFETIWDFDFINENTGFTTSGLGIYKTTNAGVNWTGIGGFPEGIHVLKFYNNTTGTAAPYFSSDNRFWITLNGGTNWILIQNNFIPVEVLYVNESIVYSSDIFSNIYKSVNSGLNWVYKSTAGDLLYFENELTGYASYGNILKRTTNGALTWETFVQSELKPTDIIVFQQNTFYSVGEGGYIIRSSDRGLNWELSSASLTQRSRSLYFADNNTGVIAGEDNIIKTTNGGSSWNTVVELDTIKVQHISSPDDQNIFAACNYGYFGISTDFGNSWNFRYTGFNTDYSKTYFVNSALGFLIKYNSDRFYRTQNGGNTWTEIHQIQSLRDISFADNNTGYAMSSATGTSIMYKTTDGGITWFTTSPFPINGQSLLNLIFTDSDNAFVSARYQNTQTSFRFLIYNSTNSGLTWNSVLSRIFYGEDIASRTDNMQQTDNNVIVAQYGKNGFKSEDRGVTWKNIINPYTTDISYFFPSVETGYITGNNVIGKIENGGTVFVSNSSSNIIKNNYELSQNYPNPFNPFTKINFSIPTAQYTKLKVYDAIGKELQVLVNERLNEGSYEAEFNGNNFASGVYFYKLEAGEFIETKRMILLK